MHEAEGDERPGPPGRRWPPALVALQHRNFALFFAGALLSNAGTWMQNLAVPYVTLQLTDSAVLVSIASFFVMVPILLMGPLGGSLADRCDRRQLLLWAQAGQAVFALALWAAWSAGVRSLPALLLLVVAGGFVNGLNIPAWQAFVSELVPRSALLNAVTLNSAQFNGAKALGPAVGGAVLAWFGPGAAFLVNGISFTTVILALLAMRVPRRDPRLLARRAPVWSSFVATLRYARSRPGILGCFVAVTALGALGSPFVQLLPVFARDVFDVGDGAYGLLGAGMGIGSVLALPLVAGRVAQSTRGRVVTGAVAIYAVAVIVFGASPWYGVGLGALVVAGGCYLAVASSLNTAMQLQVDESMRGKVLAVYVMLLTASLPAGLLLQALVVWFAGPQLTTVAFGAGFLAVLGWLRLRTELLDHLDDSPAHELAEAKAA
jgi:predicted MFS family arabinose efflux permease